MRRFRVTLDVLVVDARAAIKAARDDAEGQGLKRRGTVPDTCAAVHWIMDPGSPFDKGLQIEESSCEEINDFWELV